MVVKICNNVSEGCSPAGLSQSCALSARLAPQFPQKLSPGLPNRITHMATVDCSPAQMLYALPNSEKNLVCYKEILRENRALFSLSALLCSICMQHWLFTLYKCHSLPNRAKTAHTALWRRVNSTCRAATPDVVDGLQVSRVTAAYANIAAGMFRQSPCLTEGAPPSQIWHRWWPP